MFVLESIILSITHLFFLTLYWLCGFPFERNWLAGLFEVGAMVVSIIWLWRVKESIKNRNKEKTTNVRMQ